jgi:hypothetical protein
MSDFNVRSDSVDVEQIMEQIRARIREKRGVDTPQTSRPGAVKLEKFLDPRGLPDPLQRSRSASLSTRSRGCRYTPSKTPRSMKRTAARFSGFARCCSRC